MTGEVEKVAVGKRIFAVDFQAVVDAGEADEERKRKFTSLTNEVVSAAKKLKTGMEFIAHISRIHEDRRESEDFDPKTEELYFKSTAVALEKQLAICKAAWTAASHANSLQQELDSAMPSPSY